MTLTQSALTVTGRPNRRALAKQRTRQRILVAARQVFSERGFEAATVREIARAADLSTGAVFSTFTDKGDLFNEVIIAGQGVLVELVNVAAMGTEPSETVLLNMLTQTHRFDLDQLRLTRSAISFSWQRDVVAEKRTRANLELVVSKVSEVLCRGIARGELSPELNVKLTSEMLLDCHIANYRRAIFDDWNLDDLRSRLAAQIGVLLAGYRRAV